MKIKVLKDQTLFDVAVSATGTILSVFDLCKNNGLDSIVYPLRVGQELEVGEVKGSPKRKQYLQPYDIITGKDAGGEGVGFWFVEETFVIS